MLNFLVRASLPWRTLVKHVEKPVTGLLLTLALATVASPQLSANGAESLTKSTEAGQLKASLALTQAGQSLPDGVYLYGQAAERDQLGSAYMVFEVNQGNVVGAFYTPSSSFDCFYGRFQENEMALTVVDSYERTLHPYAIALQSPDPVATAGEGVLAPINLEGFQPIANINENDQRLLSTCQADHAGQL